MYLSCRLPNPFSDYSPVLTSPNLSLLWGSLYYLGHFENPGLIDWLTEPSDRGRLNGKKERSNAYTQRRRGSKSWGGMKLAFSDRKDYGCSEFEPIFFISGKKNSDKKKKIDRLKFRDGGTPPCHDGTRFKYKLHAKFQSGVGNESRRFGPSLCDCGWNRATGSGGEDWLQKRPAVLMSLIGRISRCQDNSWRTFKRKPPVKDKPSRVK